VWQALLPLVFLILVGIGGKWEVWRCCATSSNTPLSKSISPLWLESIFGEVMTLEHKADLVLHYINY